MEILFSFIAGLVLAAVVAIVVVKKIISARAEQAQLSAKLQAEASFQAERASLQSDLRYAQVRIAELQTAVEAAKAEGQAQVQVAKDELNKRHAEDLEARAAAHKEAMAALQARFDETVSKVTAQMKAETNEMLKERQKEFSETSNVSLGQIVNP